MMEKYREFLGNPFFIAETYAKSSLTGQMACDLFATFKREDYVGLDHVRSIHFGRMYFLDQDFAWFQSTIIEQHKLIFQLVDWVMIGKQIKDFDISHLVQTAVNEGKVVRCDWTEKEVFSGKGSKIKSCDYINFGTLRIYDVGDSYVEYLEALYAWAKQTLVWIKMSLDEQQAAIKEMSQQVSYCEGSMERIAAKGKSA